MLPVMVILGTETQWFLLGLRHADEYRQFGKGAAEYPYTQNISDHRNAVERQGGMAMLRHCMVSREYSATTTR